MTSRGRLCVKLFEIRDFVYIGGIVDYLKLSFHNSKIFVANFSENILEIFECQLAIII